MKSLKKMAELADRFEMKLSRAKITGEDPKAVTADAFFDPPGGGRSEQDFQAAIVTAGSNFLAALPETVKKCSIGASVDAPAKSSRFLVACAPPVSQDILNKLIGALNADYAKLYGKAPIARLAEKIANGKVAPDLKVSHPEILTVT